MDNLLQTKQSLLSNGLRIITTRIPHAQSVTVAFLVGGGSRYETDKQGGVFHFIEHLFFKGTPRRPTPKMVSETIEELGGYMNASTDREITAYWCKVAQPHFLTALDLLVDMLRNAVFDPDEIEKERGVILEELAMSNDHPDERVGLLIDSVLWPNQPLGRDVGGSEESVSNINRDDIVDCMYTQYVPNNVVVTVAGNIEHEAVVNKLDAWMGDWENRVPMKYFPVLETQNQPEVSLENRKSDQAHICVAIRGLAAEDPRRFALDLLSIVLGEGMSSRLFQELRENKGLVYDVHSGVSHFSDAGAMNVYAAMDPGNATLALDLILGQLALVKNGVSNEELRKAKELAKGRLVLGLEDTRSIAFWTGAQLLLRDRLMTVDQVVTKIEAVCVDDIREVAESLIVPSRLNVAIVGPFNSNSAFRNSVDAHSFG